MGSRGNFAYKLCRAVPHQQKLPSTNSSSKASISYSATLYVALNEVLFLNASSAIYILFSARLKGGRLQFANYASVWIFLLKS